MQDSIHEIQAIKQVTDSIIQELLEASRDNDPTASFALPIEKPWTDPVEELKKDNVRFSFNDKSIVKQQSPLKPKLLSIPKVKDSKRNITDRLKFLEESHEILKKKSKDANYMENLVKSDEYYNELQNFRKMYLNDLAVDDIFVLKKESNVSKKQMPRQAAATSTQSTGEMGYVTKGFYRIDDRLFPTKSNQRNLLTFGSDEGDLPPVKVSIPFSKLSKTCRSYKPHTRLSYDPRDSVDISDYLFKGNVPHIESKRIKSFRPSASIKDYRPVKYKR